MVMIHEDQNTMTTSLYQYTPLSRTSPEIRLINLLPGQYHDPLCAEISHVSLTNERRVLLYPKLLHRDELQATMPPGWNVRQTVQGRYLFARGSTQNPPYETTWVHPVHGFDTASYAGYVNEVDTSREPAYEALSYVWGEDESQERLNVMNQNNSGVVTNLVLKKNLACALHYLRLTKQPRKLWIDAICINQADIPERNDQVPRMSRIYESASRVIVWVGESANDSRLALETVSYLGQQIEHSIDFYLMRPPEAERKDWYQAGVTLPYDKRIWQALDHLFQRELFTRVWITQEIALGSNSSILQCGQDTIPFAEMRNALLALESKPLPSMSIRVGAERAVMLLSKQMWTMQRLIQTARDKNCKDPCDRVYGNLSLIPAPIATQIIPNYLETPAQVYKDTFLAALSVSKRLTLLRFATPDITVPNLPSWVPDWSSGPSLKTMLWASFAGGFSSAECEYRPPDTLRVSGLKVATVKTVGEAFRNDPEQLRTVSSTFLSKPVADQTYVTGETVHDAFLSTISLNRRSELWPTMCPSLSGWNDLLSPDRPFDRSAVWLHNVSRWMVGFALITTVEGHIGLGHPSTRKGDIVTVMLGCQHPIILRPHESHSDAYRVIGASHFHGLMFGEALLGALPNGYRIQLGRSSTGAGTYAFYNENTKTASLSHLDDPRLSPLSSEWEILEATEKLPDDPLATLRNRRTGEMAYGDPRIRSGLFRDKGMRMFELR